MNFEERIKALHKLYRLLDNLDNPAMQAIFQQAYAKNRWFTIENTQKALLAIREGMLRSSSLLAWSEHYHLSSNPSPKVVALVMAGNIPLVGFHDWLCTFVTGHHAQIKLSEKDSVLFPALFSMLADINPAFEHTYTFVERLENFDAVIATGSNNSSRYFEHYFGKHPNIIRKNRNSVAILTGEETKEDIIALGEDIFSYFGLGCRSVSKIYVPTDYNFNFFLETLHDYFQEVILHHKYKNNFDYNYAVYLLSKQSFLASGCLILVESQALSSPVSVVHYEYYEDRDKLYRQLEEQESALQCIIKKDSSSMSFGKSQQPTLFDYADNIDTIQFLLSL